ncbi:hypothetical protein Patl1_27538 [Pistacia atlantica]|uniref:Uncharacterized protein n=1 Tax=Pistacia atlantica TaxID=434234 RepID=A0ACC1BG68_9ROSI|nr:hypothetical protein Patl1_27538 [Pistacia atlantica]
MVEPAGNIASIVSAVAPVGKWIAYPIGHQIKYAFNYKSNLEKLEKEVWKLKDAREELKGNVDAAEKNMEKIKHSVKVWQEKANSIIDEAENLVEQKNNSSSNPDFLTCYKHSKKAFKLTEDKIPELLQEKKDMVSVSYPAIILEDRSLAADKDYDPFQSRESTLKEIVNALNDNNLYMLGINGMPGVGKTTLATEVGRQVKEEKLFNEVVFVEVTQTVDKKRIQKELGDHLGLRYNNETEMRNKLYARLTRSKEKNEEENEKKKKEEKEKRKEEMEKKKEEKILIILDNVWEEIDLKSIGIPEGGDNGKCKLLLTTRKRDVLVRMGSKVVEIGVLSEEESWRLFKNTIGDCTETSDKLKSLANDICKKCGCLPIAIVTVAKALKNKRDLRDFEDALLQLNRSSSTNLTGPLKMAYLSIELSYNCLSGEELKRTFLLCSLMRHQCSILDLVKYVLGLDTFEAIYKIAEARNRVYTLINDLKDSGLLINDQTNESFSMHDFVREVALSIANRDNHVFSMRNEIEGEWPSRDRLKICKMIFIRDSTISELHEGLECPELESFFMNTKVGDSHVEIPENFFKGMTKLKVLELTRMQISSLQSSLHLLEYLQTLCLDYSNFEDVVIIGKLEKLKVLSLRGSNVKQLPEQIGQLSQLRLLDLRDCHELEVIAPNVISKLFRLEELYMRGCAVQWENKGILNFKSSKASLDELNHLPNLTTLDIYIKDSKIFPKCSSSRKLKRYNISIGKDDFNDCILCRFGKWDYKKLFDVHETLRMLKLIQRNSIIRSRELECFKNVEVLCIGYLKGVKNVLYELDNQGFSQLKHLHVHNNPNVSCIVDSTKSIAHDAFPNLEMLYLFNLSKLQNIFRGHPTTNSFGNLKIILVESCNKLENIFSFSYARVLPKLEMMSVDDCKNLKEIFSNEREDNNNSNNEVLECSQLHHLTLKSLPQLTSICSEGKKPSTLQERQKDKLNDTLMPLFDIKV